MSLDPLDVPAEPFAVQPVGSDAAADSFVGRPVLLEPDRTMPPAPSKGVGGRAGGELSSAIKNEKKDVRPMRWRRLRDGVVRFRAQIRQQNSLNVAYRITVGVIGGLVLAIGIVTIPYPGPGWLTVFAGLGILATEFDWAKRLLHHGQRRYEAWKVWLRRQSPAVRLVVLAATGTLVIATLWLVGAFGILARLLWLPWPWLQSPIG